MASLYIRKHLRGGYSIFHTSLLAWCAIPSPGQVPKFRSAMLCLEAAFASIFWAMIHRDKSYGGLDTTCPWPRDSFEWKSLCGHGSLLEGIRSNEPSLGLSSEALERLAAMRKYKVNRKARDRSYKNVGETRRKANQFRRNNALRGTETDAFFLKETTVEETETELMVVKGTTIEELNTILIPDTIYSVSDVAKTLPIKHTTAQHAIPLAPIRELSDGTTEPSSTS